MIVYMHFTFSTIPWILTLKITKSAWHFEIALYISTPRPPTPPPPLPKMGRQPFDIFPVLPAYIFWNGVSLQFSFLCLESKKFKVLYYSLQDLSSRFSFEHASCTALSSEEGNFHSRNIFLKCTLVFLFFFVFCLSQQSNNHTSCSMTTQVGHCSLLLLLIRPQIVMFSKVCFACLWFMSNYAYVVTCLLLIFF